MQSMFHPNAFQNKFIHASMFRPEEVADWVKDMVGYKLITKQTPEEGVPVTKVANFCRAACRVSA